MGLYKLVLSLPKQSTCLNDQTCQPSQDSLNPAFLYTANWIPDHHYRLSNRLISVLRKDRNLLLSPQYRAIRKRRIARLCYRQQLRPGRGLAAPPHKNIRSKISVIAFYWI